MLAAPQSVLFDFDYTLADSSRGVIECVCYAFRALSLPCPSDAAICQTIGLSLPAAFGALSGSTDSAQDFTRLFIEHGDQTMVENTYLYPGAKTALDALRSLGISTGIVSTKFRRRIEAVLERDGCRGLVSVVVGGDDVLEPKPAPTGVFSALKCLGCEPRRAIYLGDSLVDTATAAAASVPFIGVATGVTSPMELEQAGAVAVTRSLEKLPHLFDATRPMFYKTR